MVQFVFVHSEKASHRHHEYNKHNYCRFTTLFMYVCRRLKYYTCIGEKKMNLQTIIVPTAVHCFCAARCRSCWLRTDCTRQRQMTVRVLFIASVIKLQTLFGRDGSYNRIIERDLKTKRRNERVKPDSKHGGKEFAAHRWHSLNREQVFVIMCLKPEAHICASRQTTNVFHLNTRTKSAL
jgi:hypothetical protein